MKFSLPTATLLLLANTQDAEAALPKMRHVPNTYCEYYMTGGCGDGGITFEEAWDLCEDDGEETCMGVLWNACASGPNTKSGTGAWKLLTAGQAIGTADRPTATCGGANQARGHWDAYVRVEHVPNTYCEYYQTGGDERNCAKGTSFFDVWKLCDEHGPDKCMGVMWNSCTGQTQDTTVNGSWKLMTAGQQIGDAENPTSTCGGKNQALGHWDVFLREAESGGTVDPTFPPTTVGAPTLAPTVVPDEPPTTDDEDVVYEDIPDMEQAEIDGVMKWIKAEVVQSRTPVCWRQSYGRGVGLIPTECPDGREKIGALCYSKCPKGTVRFGFDCHSVCPRGFRDDGLFCRQAEYGRGAGFPWQFGDWFSNSGMLRRCQKQHGRGKCEMWGAVAYPKCKSGYHPAGCCICRPNKPNCPRLGLNPGIDLSCAKKVHIGDPVPMICRPDQHYDAGLCYPHCKSGFSGVGPVCWQNCDTDQTDCAASCSRDGFDCAAAITDQIVSTLILAANVATLGLAAPVTGAVGTTLKVGGKVVAGNSKLGKALVNLIDTLQTVTTVGDSKKYVTVVQRIYDKRLGNKVAQASTGNKVAIASYDALQQFRQAFVEDFAGQTSPQIASKLDAEYHPITAKFLKRVWADLQADELAETNGYAIASVALDVIALADISGLTDVVGAFTQPTCHDVIPFPCGESADCGQ